MDRRQFLQAATGVALASTVTAIPVVAQPVKNPKERLFYARLQEVESDNELVVKFVVVLEDLMDYLKKGNPITRGGLIGLVQGSKVSFH